MGTSVTQAMDFFAHQDRARRHTLLLLPYFVAAVVLIVVAVYAAFVLAFFGAELKTKARIPLDPWNLRLFLWVAGSTLAVIAVGALYKILVLARGGEAVARLLQARPVDTNTHNPNERKLLNVVEEMAIASGMPVPTVYVLEKDKSINAFAAGFTPADAIIGVTRGSVDLLSRDELQGVIAHEFSHIFNGDMRLNLRLMGVLHGILVIALIGYTILRGVRFSGGRKKGGGAAILLFGGALFVIGYVGVFFARLIKSAVSRQREFLADASAVQFTRNPLGLAGALKKIGGLVYGSRIQSPQAEQVSHLFFADGVRPLKSRVSAFLSTHPPLSERIRRIDPSFNGVFPRVDYAAVTAGEPSTGAESHVAGPSRLGVRPRELTDTVGKLSKPHLLYAAALISSLPKSLIDQVHEPSGARAVVLALLLDADPPTRQAQFRMLGELKDALLSRDTLEVSARLERLPPQARLPLIDMALPALRRLSEGQYRKFRGLVDRLVMADEKCDLFEFAVLHMLRRHLDRHFRQMPPPKVRYSSLNPLAKDCAVLLSALAHAGHGEGGLAEKAFVNATGELGALRSNLTLYAPEACTLTSVNKALHRLAQATPTVKRHVLRACCASVAYDHHVTIYEAELLRAIADALDCPLPPLLETAGFEGEDKTDGVKT